MFYVGVILTLVCSLLKFTNSNEVLGCGGFVKSYVPIDFSKIEVKLVTKQGITKDQTSCAPNNGYYFLPLYDKGEFILEISPPPGWSFNPKQVSINVDGNDPCSRSEDINFNFEGYGITGKVESLGTPNNHEKGPKGVNVQLTSKDGTRYTATDHDGSFFFTPVFPGNYKVTISHKKWKMYKDSVDVKVAEGNTDIPANSLVIQGYDVKGKVMSEGSPVKDTTIALFSDDGLTDVTVDGCTKGEIKGIELSKKALCYVKSDSLGEFKFNAIPNGNYYVRPLYKDQNIYFEPNKIQFSVEHDSVVLDVNFEVLGFSLSGRVLRSRTVPIKDVKVMINNRIVAITDNKGEYKLEKIKIGNYRLKVEAQDLIFDEVPLNVQPDSKLVPDIFPSAYKICGRVTSDKKQLITFRQVGSMKMVQIESEPNGRFCQYLSPGKYEVQVTIDDADKEKGLQFYPVTQVIEITGENIPEILFSQLKANVNGKIQCIRASDCENVRIAFKSAFDEIIVNVFDGTYNISNVQPGIYEVTILTDRLCFKPNKQTVNINSVSVTVPSFIQSGYIVSIISSHDAKLSYSLPGQTKSKTDILRGRTIICLEQPGEYSFYLESCHKFEINPITYDTDTDTNEIILTAQKHSAKISIDAAEDFGVITVAVQSKIGNTQQKLKYGNNKYVLDLMLEPGEEAIITPNSDFLFFSPDSVKINGGDDCQDLGSKFKVVRGKVFQGKVSPPFAGVIITVKSDGQEILRTQTDQNGYYKFQPLNNEKTYNLEAEKDNFVLQGPDNNGNFKAHKLAEVVVTIVEDVTKSPLQGALISMSGGQNYRRNLQTDEEGKIVFNSLSPGEYFLKPMMKEYQFQPASKIVPVKEGETVNVQLTAKRTAFSAYGKVKILNGDPSDSMTVIATGINNCSHFSEEATSDSLGEFRIKGLHPYCSYHIAVRIDEEYDIERTAPEYITVERVTQDVTGLAITVFNPITIMNVMVRVYSENPEHYKQLKVNLFRENGSPAIIHSTGIDSSTKIVKDRNYGIIMHLPTINRDGTLYSVQLSASNLKFNPEVQYFRSNSSFKFININFNARDNTSEQLIKQTPVWGIVFIFTALCGVYNLQTILDFVSEHVNLNLGLSNLVSSNSSRRTAVTGTTSYYDNAQIEQIVQSINNVKKKPKPKKVS